MCMCGEINPGSPQQYAQCDGDLYRTTITQVRSTQHLHNITSYCYIWTLPRAYTQLFKWQLHISQELAIVYSVNYILAKSWPWVYTVSAAQPSEWEPELLNKGLVLRYLTSHDHTIAFPPPRHIPENVLTYSQLLHDARHGMAHELELGQSCAHAQTTFEL